MGLLSIEPYELIAKLMIIFLVFPVHEFAHAWAAHKLGDTTAAYSGRLTINPLAHIDIIGAIFLILTPFGWAKPVPVNPLKFKNSRKGMAITAAAGPISNLLFALVAFIPYRIIETYLTDIEFYLSTSEQTYETLSVILQILAFFVSVNIGLAIFNLIPIPPLDGSKVLSHFAGPKYDRFMYQNQMIIKAVFFLILITGILDRPLNFIGGFVIDFLYLITDFIPKLIGV
ncbi:MAG: site-2 protease family protein [Oscillospiraceae bacterium]|nr:site-2 protease family protein [Oscillospiraceae bacterium]